MKRKRADTAPKTPVPITMIAVSDGRPPSRSDTAMAIGVVTDLGAIDAISCGVAPSIS